MNRLLTTLLVTTLVLASLALSVRAEQPIQFAKALQPGDTIAIVAPASPLDRERLVRAKQRLTELGFKVRMPDEVFRANDYLAGSDQRRAEELMDAFTDPEIDAIFPGTGGYGTTRILDLLDFEEIGKHPKIMIGFSDITALHIAIHQRTGLVTFHSPVPEWGLGSPEKLAPFADHYFWRALLAEKYSVPEDPNMWSKGYAIEVTSGHPEVPAPTILVTGKGTGRVIGGNLSLVHALMGTPYEVETKGRILFLEDVGEAPYRVDRMLQTLKSAGKLDDLAGVVLGSFTRRKNEDTDGEEISIDDVFHDFFSDADYPVLMNFPAGHQRNNGTIPMGVLAELDATNKRLTLLENPVTRPSSDTP
ncbi:S66 peptidase family protein [Aeoliella mucimassa]|uniref:Putative murein peptide carboxypeptidase n=1 Tax=Aeoliella mucimassa TaxID=2527972 RepID=A0A518AS90_9BACT|nr:LD-carboxypeptidase [Aeoliella mucimassa]QDU57587.1 putative murein peptide carboxypeptidase [Aeoliella mucimassa]